MLDSHKIHDENMVTFESEERKQPKPRCLIMEDNSLKQWWDLYIICLIMYVALVVPYRLGFQSQDTTPWVVFNAVMDISFGIDIVLTFFTSYYDSENSEQVYSHRKIAKNYFRLWFWLDLFSIVPIDKILNYFLNGKGGKLNILAKFPRIARLYQLVRFIRLTKLTRLLKKRKTPKNMESKLKLREGMQRLIFFTFFIFVSIHIFSCLWVFIASLGFGGQSWLSLKQQDLDSNGEQVGGNLQTYFISLYFVVQTFTTVGYGDVSPSNTGERFFIVLIMLIGVFTFSFASGSLASIMQNYDNEQAIINERLMLLENISRSYSFSPQLYEDLKNALSFEVKKDNEDLEQLMKNLPYKLRLQVIAEVHRDLENAFPIFLQLPQENKGNLLQWISHKLDPCYSKAMEYVY